MADFTSIWIENDGLYVFGGQSKDKLVRSITDVHRMDDNLNWSKLEQSMQSGRMGHASIYDGMSDFRTIFIYFT